MGDGMRLFIELALLTLCNTLFAPKTLALDRNIYTYEYTAEVKVGVEEPASYVSKFLINGFLKLQLLSIDDEENQTYVILMSDLKLNTGYGQETSDTRYLKSVTKELHGLQNPFLAVFNNDGKFDNIKHYANETREIINIKKSIASRLQFNWETTVDELEVVGEVILKKQNIHGSCDVKYFIENSTQNIFQSEKPHVSLTMMYKPHECTNFMYNVWGYNAYYKDYIHKIKSEMNTDVRCMNKLDLEFRKPVIKELYCLENYEWNMNPEISYGSIMSKIIQPTFVRIKQNMTYKNTSSDSLISNYQIELCRIHDDSDSKNDKLDLDDVKDIEKIKAFFITITDYMKENRLIQHNMDVVNRQLLNRLQSVLNELNFENLSKIYNEIGYVKSPEMDDLRSIFIQMISYVGTKHSSLFLMDIIIHEKISEKLSIKVLKTLPLFIRQPTKALLLDLENLILINNRLPTRIKKIGILSYSHLISRVYKDSQVPDDVMMEKYLKHFSNAFEFAETTEMKLVYLHALGNTRSREAVKYLGPVLLRRNSSIDNTLVTNRLRLTAIHALSNIIDESDNSIIENLKYLLLNDKEPRNLRLAAYDVLFNILKLDISQLDFLDLSITSLHDEHIHNYHRSNIKNLEMLEALPKEMTNIAAKVRRTNVLPTLSMNSIIKPKDILKIDFLSLIKMFMKWSWIRSNSNIQVSNVLQNGFTTYRKFEILENAGDKIDVSRGLYCYANIDSTFFEKAKWQHSDVIFDVWTKSMNWVNNLDSFSLSTDIEKSSYVVLRMLHDDIKSINNEVNFEYQTFTSFSVPTVLGIDAIFENKMPVLSKLKMDIDLKYPAQNSLIFARWENGYIGASVYNIDNNLIHTVRRTKLVDEFGLTNISAIYNHSDNSWNFIYVVVTDKDENSPKNFMGHSFYTAMNVMIDKKYSLLDENSCDVCGYRLVRSSQPIVNETETITFDNFGLRSTSIVYDCDILLHVNNTHTFFESLNDDKILPKKQINNCGVIVKISPDLKKSISQIELKINMDRQMLLLKDEPWYSLPGFKFNLKLALATRKTFDNSVSNLHTLNINAESDQGRISNNLKIKLSTKYDERRNVVFCCDLLRNYPNVSDTHLPSEATLFYINTDIRATLGFSADESCADSLLSIDSNLIGKMSENHLDVLAQHAHNSRCAHQKATPLFAHPSGSFPLTWDCIYESIVNTTLRHHTLNFNHKGIPMMTLLVINSMLEKIKNNWPGINIKLVSPISRAFVDTITYEIDFALPQHSFHNFTFYDNIFYSAIFIRKFMKDSIKVTNVFPKMILFDKNKVISNANLTNWKRIHADKEGRSYSIFVKLVDDDKLSLKLDFRGCELIIEPSKNFSINDEGLLDDTSFKISMYFEKQPIRFKERMFLPLNKYRSDSEHEIRLLKIDNYIMIEPEDSQIFIYYSVNSVTFLREV